MQMNSPVDPSPPSLLSPEGHRGWLGFCRFSAVLQDESQSAKGISLSALIHKTNKLANVLRQGILPTFKPIAQWLHVVDAH